MRLKPNRNRPVRRLATSYAFLSHSKRDWNFVRALIDKLKSSNVWVDQFDLDIGDPLPDRIERGIANASVFVLVLSRNSLESKWVQYESHMAVIRNLEDDNFRFLILKIDDCTVPLRFKPFLYADATKGDEELDKLSDLVSSLGKTEAGSRKLRRHFVNRSDEIGVIEEFTNDETKSLMSLSGFFGIGKRSLATEAIKRLWQEAKISVVPLTSAHFGSRLAAELCSAASIDILPDRSSIDAIRSSMLLSVETMLSRDEHLIFENIESLLNDEGAVHDDLSFVLEHLSGLPQAFKRPAFLLSTRMPRLQNAVKLRTGYLSLRGLSQSHIVTILESEAARLSSHKEFDREAINTIADSLHGYPLAGRLAAPLFAQFDPKYIVANFTYIVGLKRDVAEAILAGTTLSEEHLGLLRLLSMTVQVPLETIDLVVITKKSAESVINVIDHLVDHNLVETNGPAIYLHPLVADFYWKQARSVPKFVELTIAIANRAKQKLAVLRGTDQAYVAWLALGCRMLYLANKPAEAYALRNDFTGELKIAALELYQRQEYDQALKYCEEYLSTDPMDFDVAYHRARALSRVGRTQDSLASLAELLSLPQSPYRDAKLHFAKGRAHLEAREFLLAREEFLVSLSKKPDLLPALQSMSEVLMKMGEYEEAYPFLERALKVSPLDSNALAYKADVLWRRNMRKEALDIMEKVVRAQPNNATFLFRLGRFLHQSAINDRAKDYFQRAKESLIQAISTSGFL